MPKKRRSVGARVRQRAAKNPDSLWKILEEEANCFYCGIEVIRPKDGYTIDHSKTYDHIYLAKDGHGIRKRNLVCSCAKCNNVRGSTDFLVFGIYSILKSEGYNVSKVDFEYN